MIFKAFKVKSNQKYVDRLLSARKAGVNKKKVSTVGILLHLSEYSDFESFRQYFNSLNIRENQIKIVAYSDEEVVAEHFWDTFFIAKHFGWNGKMNNLDLKEFVSAEFDVLISYYNQDILELNMITASSKANFKVGLSGLDQRFYDLILEIKTKDFHLFKVELEKYLTVLNKL